MRSLLSIAVILTAFLIPKITYAECWAFNGWDGITYYGAVRSHATCQQMPPNASQSQTHIAWDSGTGAGYPDQRCYGYYQYNGNNIIVGSHYPYYAATLNSQGQCAEEPETPPVTCTPGDLQKLTTTSTTGTPSQFVNRNGCQYKHTGGTVCAATGSNQNEWGCVGEYTATGETDQSTNFATDAPDNGCITNSEGKELCATNKLNCGTVNGVETCVDQIPQTGQCTFIPGGSFICEGTATPSTTLPDGTPIPEQGTITGYGENGDPVSGTIFGTQTGSDSTSPPSEVTGDITATIDETGTLGSGSYPGADTTSLDTHITGIGTVLTTPAEPSSTLSLGTQTATCNPNQFDFNFRALPININICSAIDMVRGGLWYFFAGLTIIYLLNLWDVTIRSAK